MHSNMATDTRTVAVAAMAIPTEAVHPPPAMAILTEAVTRMDTRTETESVTDTRTVTHSWTA